jgi:hypothetical protein
MDSKDSRNSKCNGQRKYKVSKIILYASDELKGDS